MKNTLIIAVSFLAVFVASSPTPDSSTAAVTYVVTQKGDTVDSYFGYQVADPYRWLEDDMSAETADWVKAQNEVTFGYLETIGFRENIKQRLTALWNYEKISAPSKEGDYNYFYKNDGLQNQWVVFRQKADLPAEGF